MGHIILLMQNFQCLDFFVRIALTDCFPEFFVQLAHRIINVHISPVDHHFGAFFPESKQFRIFRVKRNVHKTIGHLLIIRQTLQPLTQSQFLGQVSFQKK